MPRARDIFDEPRSGSTAALARRVLEVVEAIPRGRVMSYGDIATYLRASGPRAVAKVLSSHGGDEVPWWRVLRADGRCAPAVAREQLRRLRAEAVVFRTRDRVDMAASRHTMPL